MAKGNKVVASAVIEPPVTSEVVTEVEAKEVEIGYSHERLAAADNPDEYLRKYVFPKYPDKYIAKPDKEHVRQSSRGWKPLYWDTAKDVLVEVKTIDEATKTQSSVLAWRDKRIQDAINAEWRKKQDRFNRFVAEEGSKDQAVDFNNQMSQLGHDQISARPLAKKDEQDD